MAPSLLPRRNARPARRARRGLLLGLAALAVLQGLSWLSSPTFPSSSSSSLAAVPGPLRSLAPAWEAFHSALHARNSTAEAVEEAPVADGNATTAGSTEAAEDGVISAEVAGAAKAAEAAAVAEPVVQHEVVPPASAASVSNPSLLTKVVGAAAQGAVAACMAALLSAFTEPVVNRLLVERCTVAQAVGAVQVKDCFQFFLTTFPTNMLKFPIFEVINMILSFTALSGPIRGVVNGFLFCSIMLPVTNYRFRKSMKLPIEPALLYQAYPPTVLRDIAYGWARGFAAGLLGRLMLSSESGLLMKSVTFGLTIWFACILSSPFNEWRGFWLQQPGRRLPFSKFFRPERYLRSTGVGATIMGISLMVGMLLVPVAEGVFEFLLRHRMAALVGLVAVSWAVPKLFGKSR